jgi:hypothetical protein
MQQLLSSPGIDASLCCCAMSQVASLKLTYAEFCSALIAVACIGYGQGGGGLQGLCSQVLFKLHRTIVSYEL